jgi:hypothetical protein
MPLGSYPGIADAAVSTMIGICCVTVRYWGTTLGGGVRVGEGDGKLPSLADTIAAVRRELSAAQAAGSGQPVQFRTGPVELEFEVAVTRTGAGQAGVQLWVLTLGGKAELGQATTQRIKVTLQPVDPETGEDARIADARRGAPPAGPPP